MLVIAVLHADVHTSLSHPARDLSELSRLVLTQSQHHDLALFDNANAGILERLSRRTSIREKKVRDADAVRHEHAAAFDTHSGTAKRLTHFGECTRTIVECNLEIDHALLSAPATFTVAS